MTDELTPTERAKANVVAAIDLLIAERDREFIRLVREAKDLEHLRELMAEAGIIEPEDLPT